MYRPDPADTVSQNSTLTLSGYASSTGAFGISVKNYAFFADDLWRIFVEGSLANTPTYYWGQGFTAADNDGGKEKYTAQVLTLRPTVYRQLVDNVYLGVGWSLAAQNADEMGRDNLPKIESTPQGPSVFSSGFSIDVNWDDRDFVPNPRQGQYADSAIPTMLRGWGAIPDLMNGIFTTAATPRSAKKASWPGRPTEYLLRAMSLEHAAASRQR